MTTVAETLGEVPVQSIGGLPRYEVPGWQHRFGVVAGITVRSGDQPDFGLASSHAMAVGVGQWFTLLRSVGRFQCVVLGRQVHGTNVQRHVSKSHGWCVADGTDGHVTRVAGVLLAVTVADCIPIYLVAPEGKAIGLLHAGWRGIAAGMLENGLHAVCAIGDVNLSDIAVHLGVGISGNCYPVGPDTVKALGLAPSPRVDLRSILFDRAMASGVKNVTTSPWCTVSDGQFHSFRRDGKRSGRMAAYLGIPMSS